MAKFIATIRDTKNTWAITIPKELRDTDKVELNKAYQFTIDEI